MRSLTGEERDALDETTSPKPEPAEKKGRPVPKITKKTAAVGAAIGIGSAALVAALLYANRNGGNSSDKS
jgi:hypothetical protein